MRFIILSRSFISSILFISALTCLSRCYTSLLTLASAFTLDGPTNPTAGEVTEIHWTSTAKDPATFDLFLLNNPNDPFSLVAVLGENLETDLGEIHTLLPASIPAG